MPGVIALARGRMRELGNDGGPAQSAGASEPLWEAVDRLIDRAPRVSDIVGHGLQFLAARRWRALGRALPEGLEEAERGAAALTLVAPVLLQRAREAYDGPMVLMKGPEAAAFYPDSAVRPFRDLDLLVADAEEAQRSLLAAGFEPTGDPRIYIDIHHLRPLRWPGLPLVLEIHARPKWVDWGAPPSTEELLEAARPGSTGVDGVLALEPAQHALLLAAHSWAHVPLSRLIHLVDTAAMTQGLPASETAALAHRWGIGRIWECKRAVSAALFEDGPVPFALRGWARNLAGVRERTVLESHLEHWLAPFSALPAHRAARLTGRSLGRELRPAPGETWRVKLTRTGRALRHGPVRLSEHRHTLARDDSRRRQNGSR